MIIALFDTRVGNLHSLAKALEAGGATVRIESDPARLLEADGLVIPGVGAFNAAAERLAPGRAELRAALLDGYPALGICLGMQLLFESSEEGPGEGLAVIPGRVRRLRARRVPHMGWNAVVPASAQVVPTAAPVDEHMVADLTKAEVAGSPGGSEDCLSERSERVPQRPEGEPATGALPTKRPNAGAAPDPLFAGATPLVAYYANSFVAVPADEADVIAWTGYEAERFPAAVRRANAWGVQFHPEKSGAAGLTLIRNFLAEVAR